jgi:branched-subunit amino acid transport protein
MTLAPAPRRDLYALLALLALVKGWMILALSDVFLYGEELEKGTAAKAMIDGLAIDHHQLAYHYYEGGGFLISHLKALAFLVVGENLLAHKLLGLFTCALVMSFGWRILAHHCGRREALMFGLLFIFGPQAAQKISLLSLGIHFEAMFFGVLMLDQCLRLIQSHLGEDPTRPLLRLGIVAGLGLYFSYQMAVFVGGVGLALLIMRPGIVFSRGGAFGLLGFVIGALPLIWMGSLVGGELFNVHGRALVTDESRVELLGTFLNSVYADRGGFGLLTRIVYPLAGIGALAFALLRGGLVPRFLAGIALLWTVAWIGSGFILPEHDYAFDWMRMMPLWVVVLLVGSIMAGRAGRGGTVVVGALCVLGVWNTACILGEARPWSPFQNLGLLHRVKGYHYLGYVPKVLPHLSGERAGQLRRLARFDEPHPEFLHADLAAMGLSDLDQDFGADLQLVEELGGEQHLDWVRGLGRQLVGATQGDVARALTAADGMGRELGDRLAEAVGRVGHDWKVSPESLSAEVAAHMASPRAPAYLVGAGARFVRSFVVGPGTFSYYLNLDAAREWIAQQPLATREHLTRGLEEEWARWLLD